MSKELNKTTEDIMNEIHKRQIKMRPKLYFILGYILTITGLVFSFTTSIFFVGLTRFTIRSHGRMGQYRLEQLISNFPWWMLILAILGLIFGILLLRKYDFSYKINFKLLIIGLIISIVIGGFAIDMIGLNNFWTHRNQAYKQGQLRKINNIPTPMRNNK